LQAWYSNVHEVRVVVTPRIRDHGLEFDVHLQLFFILFTYMCKKCVLATHVCCVVLKQIDTHLKFDIQQILFINVLFCVFIFIFYFIVIAIKHLSMPVCGYNNKKKKENKNLSLNFFLCWKNPIQVQTDNFLAFCDKFI